MEKQLMERFSSEIVDSAYRVYKELGPGLLESVYKYCLLDELKFREVRAEQEVFLPLYYRGKPLMKDFRLDILRRR